jgi:hypothetical protein
MGRGPYSRGKQLPLAWPRQIRAPRSHAFFIAIRRARLACRAGNRCAFFPALRDPCRIGTGIQSLGRLSHGRRRRDDRRGRNAGRVWSRDLRQSRCRNQHQRDGGKHRWTIHGSSLPISRRRHHGRGSSRGRIALSAAQCRVGFNASIKRTHIVQRAAFIALEEKRLAQAPAPETPLPPQHDMRSIP